MRRYRWWEFRANRVWHVMALSAILACVMACATWTGRTRPLNEAPTIIRNFLQELLIDGPKRERDQRWFREQEEKQLERERHGPASRSLN